MKNDVPTSEQVTAYIDTLDHPLKDVVIKLREIILSADPLVSEEVKWNSPSFFYSGEMKPFNPKEYKRDIVVFNLHKTDCVRLIFPTGAKVEDASGLLGGKFTDGRKMAEIKSVEQANERAKDLQNIISKWIALVE